MKDYVFNIIIVLISSGLFGTILTTISKRRERNSVARIKEIVSAQNIALQEHVNKLAKNQANLAECLKIIVDKVDVINRQQNLLYSEFIQLRSESEEIDILLLQKLREKKIFNGESNEIYNVLLSQKNRFSQMDSKQQIMNSENKNCDVKINIDLKDFDIPTN